MYQRQTVAQLFTTMGIRSHYRLGTNAKSLCKPSVCVCLCVCMFLGMHFSSGVYMNARYKDLWRKIISLKRYSHYAAGYAEGLPARRFYCTLCCKVSRNKSSLVVTPLRSARLSPPPIRPGGWIFQKATTTSVWCPPPPPPPKQKTHRNTATRPPNAPPALRQKWFGLHLRYGLIIT